MVIDLKKLKKSGVDTEDFDFLYEPAASLIDIPDAETVLPVFVSGQAELIGEHSALVTGEIKFSVRGSCTRCLADVQKQFSVHFQQAFDQDNEYGYTVNNDKIDLSKLVDDEIALNQPITFLCDDNCKGICAGCGENLNVSACKCLK